MQSWEPALIRSRRLEFSPRHSGLFLRRDPILLDTIQGYVRLTMKMILTASAGADLLLFRL